MALPRSSPLELNTGDEVEVRSDEEGFVGAYFSASVTRVLPNHRRYTVLYNSLLSVKGGPLKETVDARHVRPSPPAEPSPPQWRLYDCVDAFYSDAWWTGVVVAVDSGAGRAVRVCFPFQREVLDFYSSEIRPHLEWLSGRWVAPHVLELPLSIYEEGTKVEIEQIKDNSTIAWFPAIVTKRIWKNNYLVQYTHFTTETETGTTTKPVEEIVDLQHMRPCPCRTSAVVFCVNDAVEAFHGSGWWPGVILKVYEGLICKYAVRLSSLIKEMDFEQMQLRPCYDWIDGSWFLSSQNPDPKIKFQEGMVVEVSSDEEGFKGVWYAATIIRPIGKSFCVEYRKLKTDDEKVLLKETIDLLHIRPVPPETRFGPDPIRLLEEVDAYYNDGWWAGVVSKLARKSRYVVYFKQWKEEIEFEHDELRPHFDWVGGRWVRASLALEL